MRILIRSVLPLALLMLAVLVCASAATPSAIGAHWRHNVWGWQILRPFPAAPYPDPSRAQGHIYEGKLFGPSHYQDSGVGIFIPDGYHPSKRGINFIVHYHGWNNHVSRVLPDYQLPQQVEESRVQAVLVVPQGPEDAPDSDDGKITHDPGDFARLLHEVARFLVQSGKAPTARIGRIAISTHSGGYRAASESLKIGGLTGHVTDVFLFDSAYGDLDGFTNWVGAGHGRRLVSVSTDDTAGGDLSMMATLRDAGKSFRVLSEEEISAEHLKPRGALFLYAPDIPHDHIMQQRSYFELFLATSRLPRRPEKGGHPGRPEGGRGE